MSMYFNLHLPHVADLASVVEAAMNDSESYKGRLLKEAKEGKSLMLTQVSRTTDGFNSTLNCIALSLDEVKNNVLELKNHLVKEYVYHSCLSYVVKTMSKTNTTITLPTGEETTTHVVAERVIEILSKPGFCFGYKYNSESNYSIYNWLSKYIYLTNSDDAQLINFAVGLCFKGDK